LEPLVLYLSRQLGLGVSCNALCQELLDDQSLLGRAYPRVCRSRVAAQLRAQTKIRKALDCSFKPLFAWFLERKAGQTWDVVSKQVVLAGSVKEARVLASEKAGEEGARCWLSGRRSTCTRLPSVEGPARALVNNYAG